MKKLFAATLVILIVSFVSAHPAQSQSAFDPQTGKIKARVNKVGVGNDVTVTLKTGDDYHGSIKGLALESFTIDEVDLKQPLEIKFAEVRKVQSGYGHSRDLHGRRIPPRKQFIGLIIAAAAILVPVLLVVASKD